MRVVITVAFVLVTSGCAAVLGSKQKDFDLNSSPTGADVYLNGNRLGSTPLKVKLSNQATHTLSFAGRGIKRPPVPSTAVRERAGSSWTC